MFRKTLGMGAAGVAMFAAQAYGQYTQQYPQQQYPKDRYDDQGRYSQQDRYDRNDGRYNNRSRNQRGDLFETVREDLQQATQYSRRGTDQFNSAFDHLARFEEGRSRGDFRRGELDRVIEATQNVIRRGGLPQQLRAVLYRDLTAMRDYRARMEGGQRGYSNGYDRDDRYRY